MTRPVTEELSCTQKRRYATGMDAQKACSSKDFKNMGSYKCEFCGGWHIYTKGKNQKMVLNKKKRQAKIHEAGLAPDPWADKNKGKGLNLPEPVAATTNLGDLLKEAQNERN